MYNQDFIEQSDGVRIFDNGIKKYRVVLNKSGDGLWFIEAVDGQLPAPLRGLRFTSSRLAAITLKNHADEAPLRKEIYRKLRKAETEETEGL